MKSQVVEPVAPPRCPARSIRSNFKTWVHVSLQGIPSTVLDNVNLKMPRKRRRGENARATDAGQSAPAFFDRTAAVLLDGVDIRECSWQTASTSGRHSGNIPVHDRSMKTYVTAIATPAATKSKGGRPAFVTVFDQRPRDENASGKREVSGGQRQRIAWRAMRNPDVLILTGPVASIRSASG